MTGDVLFFDSFAPHRSRPNKTAQLLRVLYISCNKLSADDSRETGREYRFRV